jgi:hypothetical protein
MTRKFSPALFIAFALIFGAGSIMIVSGRTDIRTVDVLQLFAGGMVTGALLTSALMQLRRKDASV